MQTGHNLDALAVTVSAPRLSRPNVVIFVTDDQRADGTLDAMPQTRSWFEQGGIRFANAFATTPLCCPGRASIFTGQYAHNHGIRTNGGWDLIQRLDQRSTLQRYLKEAGYRTALVGKYFYSWNHSVPPPYVDDWALTAGGYHNAYFTVNGQGRHVPYSTDFTAEHAVSLLQQYEANDAQPWFMYVGTNAPHLVTEPEAAYAQAPVGDWAGNPAVFEQDRTDKPSWVRTFNPLFGDTFADVLEARRGQLRTLMSVDDLVDSVLEKVQGLGEGGDTLAFFLSDNGQMWGEHGLGIEKRFPYTQSVQIPLLMRWPGQAAAGATDNRLVANVDVFPTVLDATGLSPAHPVDGVSLLAPGARSRMLLEYWRSPDGGPPGWASIRTPTHQYIEWYADDGLTRTFREYYDLVGDPWQLQNLLADGDPSNDPNVEALSSQLALDRACVGKACSFIGPSPPPPPPACPVGQYQAQYYNTMTVTGTPVLTRCEGAIDHAWGNGGPGGGVNTDGFSARWVGTHTFAGGTYTFTARTDDGIRVWVDGTLLIDAWKNQPATTYTASRTLSPGDHEVKVEYFENTGWAVTRLSWGTT
jgi:arylsulfatase A-like enzyme